MSKLLLYTDTTTDAFWHFATLHTSRAMLEQHNIHFAPGLTTPRTLPIKIHSLLSSSSQLQPLRQLLDKGQDVILFTRALAPTVHQNLAQKLQQSVLARHSVHVLHILQNTIPYLEQKWRTVPASMQPGNFNIKLHSEQAALIKILFQEWGRDNVTIMVSSSQEPAATTASNMTEQIFGILGLPAPVFPQKLPPSPLFLKSSDAVRLWHTLEVRSNSWPALDKTIAEEKLRLLEQDWEKAPLSPLALRKELAQSSQEDVQEVTELLELDSSALSCPEWLLTQPEISLEQPLLQEHVDSFAAALPDSVTAPLLTRFTNDRCLLTRDQQQMKAALLARDKTTASRIGNPAPPVTLTVLTMTYNHEKYIAQCMDSVLAQKTDFPVRHIVLDHGSADKTREIIAAYAARHTSIQPVFCEHLPQENVRGLFLRCRSPYAALCDGDDYFLDPLKLQRQVDFLEENPQCALCFHPVGVVWDDNSEPPGVFPSREMLPRGIRKEYYLSDLLRSNIIQTNSVVYRWRFKDGLPDWFQANLCPGDWYWHLLHAEMGKIGFLPHIMAVYRRHKKSLYHQSFSNPVEHRRKHGLLELHTYHAVNEHFHGHYFSRLAVLANGIFADFLKIYKRDNDDSLLAEACSAAPEFAAIFRKQLEQMLQASRKTAPETER